MDKKNMQLIFFKFKLIKRIKHKANNKHEIIKKIANIV